MEVGNKDEDHMVLAYFEGKNWKKKKVKQRQIHELYGNILGAIQ